MKFPLVEEVKRQIHAAVVKQAPSVEVDRIGHILNDAVTHNVLDDYDVDPESLALDQLFRDERLSRADVTRFYQLWITLKFRPDAR